MIRASATQAEEHFAADPSVSLVKLRQFGEVLAKRAAAKVGLYVGDESQQGLIDRLSDRGVIGATQRTLFHDLRRVGNAAVHEGTGITARRCTSFGWRASSRCGFSAASATIASSIGLVVALGRAMESTTDGGFWWSLLATVVVALAFQPLRRGVVRIADRAAYGTRAAPYDALADFSRRIGRSPSSGELLPTIAAAAGEAVRADRVVVRLDGGEDVFTATWPATTEAPVETTERDVLVPIADASGPLGSITVSLPPGRDVRPAERRLLADIAEQAGLALRNARLRIEPPLTSASRRRARDLTASRNRMIGAVDTEKRRLESSIAARVLPTMEQLRSEIALAAEGAAQPERIAECVDLATGALESLRELAAGSTRPC